MTVRSPDYYISANAIHTLLSYIAYFFLRIYIYIYICTHETLTTTLGLFKNVNGISDVGEDGLALIKLSLGGGFNELLRHV